MFQKRECSIASGKEINPKNHLDGSYLSEWSSSGMVKPENSRITEPWKFKGIAKCAYDVTSVEVDGKIFVTERCSELSVKNYERTFELRKPLLSWSGRHFPSSSLPIEYPHSNLRLTKASNQYPTGLSTEKTNFSKGESCVSQEESVPSCGRKLQSKKKTGQLLSSKSESNLHSRKALSIEYNPVKSNAARLKDYRSHQSSSSKSFPTENESLKISPKERENGSVRRRTTELKSDKNSGDYQGQSPNGIKFFPRLKVDNGGFNQGKNASPKGQQGKICSKYLKHSVMIGFMIVSLYSAYTMYRNDTTGTSDRINGTSLIINSLHERLFAQPIVTSNLPTELSEFLLDDSVKIAFFLLIGPSGSGKSLTRQIIEEDLGLRAFSVLEWHLGGMMLPDVGVSCQKLSDRDAERLMFVLEDVAEYPLKSSGNIINQIKQCTKCKKSLVIMTSTVYQKEIQDIFSKSKEEDLVSNNRQEEVNIGEMFNDGSVVANNGKISKNRKEVSNKGKILKDMLDTEGNDLRGIRKSFSDVSAELSQLLALKAVSIMRDLKFAIFPYFPLQREHVRMCINAELQRRKVPKDKWNKLAVRALQLMYFYKKNGKDFSDGGCKLVKSRLDFLLSQ